MGLTHQLIVSNKNTTQQSLKDLIENCPQLINQTGPFGWTPLHFAVRENNKEQVAMLIKNGADRSLKDDLGRTPKYLARYSDNKEIKKILKSKK